METIQTIFIVIICYVGLVLVCSLAPRSKRNTRVSDRISDEDDIWRSRYVDGHRVRTRDDQTKWYVFKNYNDRLESRFRDIEKLLNDPAIENASELVEEWKNKYQEYQNICKEYRIDSNLKYSLAYIDAVYSTWLSKRDEYIKEKNELENYKAEIDKYIREQPGKIAVRYKLFEAVAAVMGVSKETVITNYRVLKKEEVLSEIHPQGGKVMVSICKPKRVQVKKPKTLRPSYYDASRYEDVDKKIYYKAIYTVADPIEVNKTDNTCFFISKITGETYSTALDYCTCPVYSYGRPCKHMVRLALYLKYLNPSDIE